jgi:type VI protein secretion system component VasK
MSADWIPVGSLGVISSVVAWLVAWRVSAARSEGRSDAQHDAEDAKDTSVKQDIRDLRNEVRATMEELRTPGVGDQ